MCVCMYINKKVYWERKHIIATTSTGKNNKKNTHTYWQIIKIDIQQYGKIRWSLL